MYFLVSNFLNLEIFVKEKKKENSVNSRKNVKNNFFEKETLDE
jgi:hypothetical protein